MGHAITVTDAMDPARMAALAVVLGLRWDGDVLAPFAHQVYFWTPVPGERLGRDGHPAVGGGGVVPDMGLPRRMWAGGRLEFRAPLHAGRTGTKTTRLDSAVRKEGRTGPLAFVTLRHDIAQDGQVCVTEWQDLVYRPEAGDSRTVVPPQAPEGGEGVTRTFGPVDLFRYSALTLNGHRIHYDAEYARDVEGYAGLVVHGPLLAQHLMLMAGAGLARFAFRGISPLIAGESARFVRDGARLWVAGPDGRLCMEAEAS